jgi:hypothetical protein
MSDGAVLDSSIGGNVSQDRMFCTSALGRLTRLILGTESAFGAVWRCVD